MFKTKIYFSGILFLQISFKLQKIMDVFLSLPISTAISRSLENDCLSILCPANILYYSRYSSNVLEQAGLPADQLSVKITGWYAIEPANFPGERAPF